MNPFLLGAFAAVKMLEGVTLDFRGVTLDARGCNLGCAVFQGNHGGNLQLRFFTICGFRGITASCSEWNGGINGDPNETCTVKTRRFVR